jgi:hypothetical protein
MTELPSAGAQPYRPGRRGPLCFPRPGCSRCGGKVGLCWSEFEEGTSQWLKIVESVLNLADRARAEGRCMPGLTRAGKHADMRVRWHSHLGCILCITPHKPERRLRSVEQPEAVYMEFGLEYRSHCFLLMMMMMIFAQNFIWSMRLWSPNECRHRQE